MDAGLDRVRRMEEKPGKGQSGPFADIKMGVVGTVKKNPTMGGGINRAPKGQK
jgi:hypothetical protein